MSNNNFRAQVAAIMGPRKFAKDRPNPNYKTVQQLRNSLCLKPLLADWIENPDGRGNPRVRRSLKKITDDGHDTGQLLNKPFFEAKKIDLVKNMLYLKCNPNSNDHKRSEEAGLRTRRAKGMLPLDRERKERRLQRNQEGKLRTLILRPEYVDFEKKLRNAHDNPISRDDVRIMAEQLINFAKHLEPQQQRSSSSPRRQRAAPTRQRRPSPRRQPAARRPSPRRQRPAPTRQRGPSPRRQRRQRAPAPPARQGRQATPPPARIQRSPFGSSLGDLFSGAGNIDFSAPQDFDGSPGFNWQSRQSIWIKLLLL